MRQIVQAKEGGSRTSRLSGILADKRKSVEIS
jgi:hypothetical protein